MNNACTDHWHNYVFNFPNEKTSLRERCCQDLFSALTSSCLHISLIISTSRKPRLELGFELCVIWIWVIISWTIGRGPFALGMCRWIPPRWFERVIDPWYISVTRDYSPPLSASSIPMTTSACASSLRLHTHSVTLIKLAIDEVNVDDAICLFSLNFNFTFQVRCHQAQNLTRRWRMRSGWKPSTVSTCFYIFITD